MSDTTIAGLALDTTHRTRTLPYRSRNDGSNTIVSVRELWEAYGRADATFRYGTDSHNLLADHEEAIEMNKSFPWVNGIISASRRTTSYRQNDASEFAGETAAHGAQWRSGGLECRTLQRISTQYTEDWDEAHQINAAFAPLATGALAGLATSAAPSAVTSQADTEAALRQAELLGATADQRRKLRGIVEEAAAARKAAEDIGLAFRVQAEELEAVRQQHAALIANVGATASDGPITDPSDKRVWEIFGKAAAEADRQGYCSVYDQISNAVGIPTRATLREAGYIEPRRFDVRTTVYLSFDVTVTVEADSESDAINEVDNMSSERLFDEAQESDQINGHDYTRYDLDRHDAQEAEVVED